MRAALLVAALLAGCGIKAAPRPPLRPGATPEARPIAAEPTSCDTCDTTPSPAPAPRTP
jgi:hypothetical protein